MDITSFDCPHCGQKNLTSKLNYCTFCYTRFSGPDSESDADASESQASRSESTPADAALDQDKSEPEIAASVESEMKPAEDSPVVKPVSYSNMVCPHCVADLPQGAQTCPECNKHLDEDWF